MEAPAAPQTTAQSRRRVLPRSRMVRNLLFASGSLFLALGLIGLVVPLLPTTPFMLLAAACYARSSRRMHAWLILNPVFGRSLRRYRAGHGIPVRTKLCAIALVAITISLSVTLAVPEGLWWGKLILFAIGAGVCVHIALIRPRTYQR